MNKICDQGPYAEHCCKLVWIGSKAYVATSYF